jgi:cysteine dioxygenase
MKVLLNQIEQRFSELEKPTISEIKQVLQSLGPLLTEVPLYTSEPVHLPYGRNVIFQTNELEVVVIKLPGSCQTPIHDHGDSVGCMYVAQGELMNVEYRLEPNGFPEQIGFSTIHSGQFCEASYGQIHELVNPRKVPAISLHVYSPVQVGAKRYKLYSEVLDFVI